MKEKFRLLISVVAVLFNNNTFAQTFNRITDPSNPVTTDQFESGGGSWIDVNNDGLLDLFVSNGNLSSQNNSLYLNLGNGNFREVVTGNIVMDGGSSIGSTWGDYDNDGFLDCFVTNRNNFGNFLYRGNGDTTFTKITTGNVVTDVSNSNSSSWVDANNDGNLDLYVVNFQAGDFIYTNNGSPGYTFSSGAPLSTGTAFSIPGAWADYNNDLLPDLFIGNAGTQNDLIYTNNGNLSFTQTSLPDGKPTLGASWADFDNDGDLDLFVANYQNTGNVLYINSGMPSYALTAASTTTLAEAGNSVGSSWGDVDNDGDLDLIVSNDGGNNFLYLNDGPPNYTFTRVLTGDVVNDGGNSFGAVIGDYDNDGQLDLFIANRLNQQNFLYRNIGNANHWFTVKCIGASSNKSAIGTKVKIRSNVNGSPTWQMQEVEGQTGYNSQNLWLHFGTGNATLIDTIVFQWPSGNVDSCFNILPDQFYTAMEGSCLNTGLNNPATTTDFIIQNPTHNCITIQWNRNFTGLVTLMNATGQIILEEEFKNQLSIQMHVQDIPNGIYLLCATEVNTNKITTKKIIIN